MLLLNVSLGQVAVAEQLTIAVAANFSRVMKTIVRDFAAKTGHGVSLVSGSTGKHYAQIKQGAPFDAFFAADSKRPALLEKEKLAVAHSRFTYALGRVVLWSSKAGSIGNGREALADGKFNYLAIANPKLAPYGVAAQEILTNLGLFTSLKDRLIRGENIGQTFHFVKSASVEFGFVAYSQVKSLPAAMQGSYWKVPQHLYSPIVQQAVLLRDTRAGRLFFEFIKSDLSRNIIRDHGYDFPDNSSGTSKHHL